MQLTTELVFNGPASKHSNLTAEVCCAGGTSQTRPQLKVSFHWVFPHGRKFNSAFLPGAGVWD